MEESRRIHKEWLFYKHYTSGLSFVSLASYIWWHRVWLRDLWKLLLWDNNLKAVTYAWWPLTCVWEVSSIWLPGMCKQIGFTNWTDILLSLLNWRHSKWWIECPGITEMWINCCISWPLFSLVKMIEREHFLKRHFLSMRLCDLMRGNNRAKRKIPNLEKSEALGIVNREKRVC